MSALPWVIIAGVVGALALSRKSNASPPTGVVTPQDFQAFFYPEAATAARDESEVITILKGVQTGPIKGLLALVPGHNISVSRPSDPLIQKVNGSTNTVIGPFDANLVWLSADKTYGAIELPDTVVSLLPGTPDPQRPGQFINPPIAKTILAYIAPSNL